MKISYVGYNIPTKSLQELRTGESFKFDDLCYIKTDSEIMPEKPGSGYTVNCVCLETGNLVPIKTIEEVTPIEVEVTIHANEY